MTFIQKCIRCAGPVGECNHLTYACAGCYHSKEECFCIRSPGMEWGLDNVVAEGKLLHRQARARGAPEFWPEPKPGFQQPVKRGDPLHYSAAETSTDTRRIVLTPASQIIPEPVVWAWEDDGHGRIPAGSLGLFAGREGTGKSSFLIWLAARITTGELPGTFYGKPPARDLRRRRGLLEVHDRAPAHGRRRGSHAGVPGRSPGRRGRHRVAQPAR